jgi:hypothetical protein
MLEDAHVQTRIAISRIKKSGVRNSRSEQDVRASGFAWVARKPKLISGAKRARILTEINRLTQIDFPLNGENRGPVLPLVTANTRI